MLYLTRTDSRTEKYLTQLSIALSKGTIFNFTQDGP